MVHQDQIRWFSSKKFIPHLNITNNYQENVFIFYFFLFLLWRVHFYLYSQVRSKCIFIISDDGLFQSQHKQPSKSRLRVIAKNKELFPGWPLKCWIVKLYKTMICEMWMESYKSFYSLRVVSQQRWGQEAVSWYLEKDEGQKSLLVHALDSRIQI